MWETLEEFVEWYKENKFPIRPPFEDPIYITDISYSFVLYREGQYQAELYLIKPNSRTPTHSHPGVENIIMLWSGGISVEHNNIFVDSSPYDGLSENGTSKLFGVCGNKLTDENTHAVFTKEKGGALLSLEKWPEGVKPNSVTVNWLGDAIDTDHQQIIKSLK